MKNYLLYSFLEKSISISDIEIIDYFTNSVFDLIINNKKEEFTEKHGDRSSPTMIINMLQESREWLFHNYITHNYMLIGVGESYAKLSYLNNGRIAKNIFEWPKYVKMRKNKSKFVTVEYEKYSESLAKLNDWVIDQKILIASEIILVLMLQYKHCTYSKFKKLLRGFIENKNIPIYINDNEFDELVDNLVQSNYLIYLNETLYFPNNIYYNNEAPKVEFEDLNKSSKNVLSKQNNKFSNEGKVHVVTRGQNLNVDIKNIKKERELPEQKKEVVQREHLKSVKDIIEEDTLPAKILKNILEEHSLIKICDELNINISDIFEIKKDILEDIDKIYEINKYKSRFEKYRFTPDFFEKYFLEPKYVFNFLTLALNKGEKNLFHYLTSTNDFSIHERNKILREEFGGFLNRFGEYVEPTFENIFDEILYKNKNRYFKVVEFQYYYENMATKYTDDISVSTTQFLKYSENSKYTVSTSRGLFRYFDANFEKKLLEELYVAIESLKDGLYNTKILFEKANRLMIKLGIRDEFELQSILRKVIDNLPEKFSIMRRNFFIKGDINKFDFYKRELLDSVGETVDDLSNILQSKFGLNKLSSSAYINKEFKEYIKEGLIIGDNKEINSNLYNLYLLKRNFNKTFYLLKDAIYIFEEVNIEWKLETLNEAGYLLEKGIVYKNVYESSYHAVLSYLKGLKKFSTNASKLFYDREVQNIMRRAERNREIIALSEGHYLTRGLLNQRGISINDIQNFIESVLKFVENYEYFTLPQIKEDGFKNRLLIFDFDIFCYERLLSTSDYFMKVTSHGSEIFAIRNKSDFKLNSFIDYELEQYDFVENNMDIYDFVDLLNEKYYTNLSEDYVITILQKSRYFYAPLLKMVFETREDYYDYIY